MVYAPSTIKRNRRTNAAIGELKDEIARIAEEQQPMTCRQMFYQLVTRDLIDKTTQQYKAVCRYLVEMRREGAIPYHYIADNTRWVRKPNTWSSLEFALETTAETYRRMLWNDQQAYVEIWCESDSIAGVISDVTYKWDVPLHALRGFGSETYLYSVAESLADETRPVFIFYFGDYDPSGVYIDRDAEKKLRHFAPDVDITFERRAVTKQQIENLKLPGKPPKSSDSRSRSFDHTEAVEIESIPPDMLRDYVEWAITEHIDNDVLARTRMIEAAEQATLMRIKDSFWQSE